MHHDIGAKRLLNSTPIISHCRQWDGRPTSRPPRACAEAPRRRYRPSSAHFPTLLHVTSILLCRACRRLFCADVSACRAHGAMAIIFGRPRRHHAELPHTPADARHDSQPADAARWACFDDLGMQMTLRPRDAPRRQPAFSAIIARRLSMTGQLHRSTPTPGIRLSPSGHATGLRLSPAYRRMTLIEH